MNYCEQIRKDVGADRLFCLYPYREANGLVQACTIAYNPATTIDLRFFDEKYHIQVWVDMEGEFISYYPGDWRYKCFCMGDFAGFLWHQNREAYFVFVYSLFFKVKYYAAREAVEVYADAIHAAEAAAYAAETAAEAAETAAYAVAKATAGAADVYAYAVYTDAKATADAYAGAFRGALRALFRFRRKVHEK